MAETLTTPPISDQDLPPDPLADRDPLLESLEQRLGITPPEADPTTGAILTTEAKVATDGLEAVEKSAIEADEEPALFSIETERSKQKPVLNQAAVQPEQDSLFMMVGDKPAINKAVEAKPAHQAKHRDTSGELSTDDRELERLKAAKASMIKMFGQEEYARRFAYNPHVDPDAYLAERAQEVKPGRHAKNETTDDAAEFQREFGLMPEEFDALPRAEQVKVLKGEYRARVEVPADPKPVLAPRAPRPAPAILARKHRPLHWSEEDSGSTLHRVSRDRDSLNLHWSEEDEIEDALQPEGKHHKTKSRSMRRLGRAVLRQFETR